MRQPNRSKQEQMVRLACAIVLCGLLTAQQTVPPPAAPPSQKAPQVETATQQPETVISTTVQYVTTPAWVYDRDGEYVNGLA